MSSLRVHLLENPKKAKPGAVPRRAVKKRRRGDLWGGRVGRARRATRDLERQAYGQGNCRCQTAHEHDRQRLTGHTWHSSSATLTSPALKRGTFAPSLLPQIRLSHSFTDDPEQLQVVMGQLQQTQEMEEKDDLLLHQSEKEARAAAQQALDQANSLHQAAEAAEEQALKTQQRNKDLAMKAKVLEQRARMEGAKVAAVSKAVAKMAAEKEQIRASDDEQ
eukprot:s2318_g4.t4